MKEACLECNAISSNGKLQGPGTGRAEYPGSKLGR